MVATTSARLQGDQEAAWADYQQGGLSFQEGWARQRGLLDRCEQEARRQLSVLMDLLEQRQKDEKLAPAAKREAEKTATSSSAPKKTSAAAPKQESAASSSGPQQTWSAGILSSFLQQKQGQEREGDKEKENVKEKEDAKEKDNDSIWRDDGKLQCPECRMRLVSHGRVLRDHIGEEYKYKDLQ